MREYEFTTLSSKKKTRGVTTSTSITAAAIIVLGGMVGMFAVFCVLALAEEAWGALRPRLPATEERASMRPPALSQPARMTSSRAPSSVGSSETVKSSPCESSSAGEGPKAVSVHSI